MTEGNGNCFRRVRVHGAQPASHHTVKELAVGGLLLHHMAWAVVVVTRAWDRLPWVCRAEEAADSNGNCVAVAPWKEQHIIAGSSFLDVCGGSREGQSRCDSSP